MPLPQELLPVGVEPVMLPDGRGVEVPKARPTFVKWRGVPMTNTFGGKAVLDYRGEACFAELIILRLFVAAGWEARWVETYGAAAVRPRFLSTWSNEGLKAQPDHRIADTAVQRTLDAVARSNDASYSGCWDVLAWNASQLVFAESKRQGHDRLRATQRRWLASGIAAGLSEDSFLIVEWSAT